MCLVCGQVLRVIESFIQLILSSKVRYRILGVILWIGSVWLLMFSRRLIILITSPRVARVMSSVTIIFIAMSDWIFDFRKIGHLASNMTKAVREHVEKGSSKDVYVNEPSQSASTWHLSHFYLPGLRTSHLSLVSSK